MHGEASNVPPFYIRFFGDLNFFIDLLGIGCENTSQIASIY